uniref:Uncharacterized protein n=1 Tax=Plectus sambesii TaxID=2011161 RepID=A0A914VPG6_9BILA
MDLAWMCAGGLSVPSVGRWCRRGRQFATQSGVCTMDLAWMCAGGLSVPSAVPPTVANAHIGSSRSVSGGPATEPPRLTAATVVWWPRRQSGRCDQIFARVLRRHRRTCPPPSHRRFDTRRAGLSPPPVTLFAQ